MFRRRGDCNRRQVTVAFFFLLTTLLGTRQPLFTSVPELPGGLSVEWDGCAGMRGASHTAGGALKENAPHRERHH